MLFTTAGYVDVIFVGYVDVVFVAPSEGPCRGHLLFRYILPPPKAGPAHNFVCTNKHLLLSSLS